MPGSPHNFGVTVYDTDETTAVADIQVTIRNESSNESSTLNTNAQGQVIFNLANSSVFENGWTSGDRISYFVRYQGYEAKESVLVFDVGGTQVTLTLVDLTVAPSLRYFTVQEFLDHFDLSTYEEDNANGVKPQVVVQVGQQIEKEIDKLTYRVWDNNAGDYYSVSDEYQEAKYYQKIFWLKNTPINSISRIEVNTNPTSSEEVWKNIMYTLLDAADATTDWSAGTDGVIALNTTNGEFNEGTGCLNITKTGNTTASVLFSKSLSSAVDFTGSQVRFDLYVADVTELASSGAAIEIRIGSDASNYYSIIFTKGQIGQGGWNSLVLDHNSADSNASTTGTPNATECDYIAVNITYASSSTTVSAGDMRLDNIRFNNKEDLNINYSTGRVAITDASDYFPEPGKDQFRSSYKQGTDSVDSDIKLLAILMTGRTFGKRTLTRLNIDASEVEGLSSAIQNLNVNNDEIEKIIERNRFPPILNMWKENAQY